MMTSHELRQKYLDFFKSKEHVVLLSCPLIPENDPTTLFTGSGMQPMVPYLLGEKHPEGPRLADSQKCLRTQDIDEVGDNRHTTFFEMLGNWSLGDYFKKEQIEWIFDFVVNDIGLDPNRIYISCFRGKENINIPKDEETAKFWQEHFEHAGVKAEIRDMAEERGMQGGRIFYYDETKNWWSRAGIPAIMPIGEPGGPDSEMFWDFGVDLQLHEKSKYKDQMCHVNCDCGRYLEIGNNVFMQYKKTDEGFIELENKNIDFGGGLERMAAALNDSPDVFKIDLFTTMCDFLEEKSGKKYDESKEFTRAFRIIMDHLRGVTFLVGDDAIPSNKDQGYFTRRLMRRAIRYGSQLGITDNFCKQVASRVIEIYKEAYPNLVENKNKILDVINEEENKFRKTLKKGLSEMKKELETMKKLGSQSKHGDLGSLAFYFFETFGFPLELFFEEVSNYGIVYNVGQVSKLFNEEMKKHQELSRAGAEEKFKGGLADTGEMSVKYHTTTHLLHAALRQVLGEHVQQKGSNITADRLRFDFTHPDKMSDEEKKKVENLVNTAIEKDYPINIEEMTVEEAKTGGAIGLFEDRYGERVKVYTVGKGDEVFSREICGGPHVGRTGDLGKFRITKEESSSSGVRRIKAVLE